MQGRGPQVQEGLPFGVRWLGTSLKRGEEGSESWLHPTMGCVQRCSWCRGRDAGLCGSVGVLAVTGKPVQLCREAAVGREGGAEAVGAGPTVLEAPADLGFYSKCVWKQEGGMVWF